LVLDFNSRLSFTESWSSCPLPWDPTCYGSGTDASKPSTSTSSWRSPSSGTGSCSTCSARTLTPSYSKTLCTSWQRNWATEAKTCQMPKYWWRHRNINEGGAECLPLWKKHERVSEKQKKRKTLIAFSRV